jgi:hypothetical protein
MIGDDPGNLILGPLQMNDNDISTPKHNSSERAGLIVVVRGCV